MPLIQSLKNPAMRGRHWDQIKEAIGKTFDHHSEEFTLEQIIVLGLDQYADKIGDVSAAASKELSIEEAIGNIRQTWEMTSLDIIPYKDRGHFRLRYGCWLWHLLMFMTAKALIRYKFDFGKWFCFRATDEVFQALDDNQVTLSTMKASRYVQAFEADVDYWERTLSHILEVTEMLLTVQRQWMYLEVFKKLYI